MHWFQTLDAGLFHWINSSWRNPFFDAFMPFFSNNPFFNPAFLIASLILFWKGGARGRICVVMLVLAIALGDSLVCHTVKQVVHRPRPFLAFPDAHVPDQIGRTDSGSMPSSHAANWFAATMILFIYYRRSLWFMLPAALLVSFSRIYNGVHYPGDVLAGAVLGAGYAAGLVWTLNALWQWIGRRWFPLWWQRLSSLLIPVLNPPPATSSPQALDRHFLRLAYAVIFLLFFTNLAYLASGKIGLSGDEAYQWVWSKHLALSYYSKPLLIAVTQFLGTSLWGDTVFGVRFFSPVIACIISIVLLRFMAKVVNVRSAFWLSLIVPTIPLFAIGSILMTIDPLSVLFWTLAMIAGWRAVQDNSTVKDWVWVGLWMGLGFLSKYTALFQLLCWVVFFALWPPARKQLRRPGPYVALFVNLLCTAPVLIWNYQHHWITIQHVSEGGHFDEPWAFTVANLWKGFYKFTSEFLLDETGLLNPFFFLPAVWAAVVFWRRERNDPLLVYFFSMGAPLFLCYFLFTFHSRVLPNWIVPSVLPLLCLAVVYWDGRWRAGFTSIKFWLQGGLIIGLLAVILLHDLDLLPKLTGIRLSPADDPTCRVRGWNETANVVEAARQKLTAEGKPVFIIGGHYGITGQLTFNLPEARATVRDHPLVYFQSSKIPKNQFFFWAGYHDRKGQNAIFVQELNFVETSAKPPPELVDEFESVTDLGVVLVMDKGQLVRRIQIYECRNLR